MTMTKAEIARAQDSLRRILEAIEAGEVTADAPQVAHLRGALAALEAMSR